MKSRKGKRPAPRSQKRVFHWQIVLVDQRPLRKKAADECTRAMARLEKAQTEWRRFLQEDRAAFDRWMASTFGAVLSQIREIEATIHTRQMLVQEVEMEMMFGGARNPRAAYQEVQNRRENPPPADDPHAAPPPPPPADAEGIDDDPFEDFSEAEQIALFEEFLRFVMGMNPERMSKKKYEQMFAEFKAEVLGQDSPPGPQFPPPPIAPVPPPDAGQSRLKELYRQLVRRLHPDTKADSDEAVSMIWHEVQEAYRMGSVERLEMLLAMTDLREQTSGEHTSLSQMRSVLTELRRSLNALQRNLKLAKQDPAWNFHQRTDRSALEKRVRGDLESRRLCCESILRELDDTIARWSAPAKARKKPAQTRQAPDRRSQMDFFF